VSKIYEIRSNFGSGGSEGAPPPIRAQGVRAQLSSRTCQPILDLNCAGELRWLIRSAVSCDLRKRGRTALVVITVGTGIAAFMRDRAVNGSLAIVPGVANTSNAVLLHGVLPRSIWAAIHSHWQPDTGRWQETFSDSMRELARFITRRCTRVSQRLQQIRSVLVLKYVTAVKYDLWQGLRAFEIRSEDETEVRRSTNSAGFWEM
jgi:hypothetical protein